MEWVEKLHIIDQIFTYISDMSVFSFDTAWLQVRMKCNYENDQQDALYKLIYYSRSVLHVSGDVFAHNQECMTVFTVSGSVHPSCCRLVSRMS